MLTLAYNNLISYSRPWLRAKKIRRNKCQNCLNSLMTLTNNPLNFKALISENRIPSNAPHLFQLQWYRCPSTLEHP